MRENRLGLMGIFLSASKVGVSYSRISGYLDLVESKLMQGIIFNSLL